MHEDLSDVAIATVGVMVREINGRYSLKADISELRGADRRYAVGEGTTLADAADSLRSDLRRLGVAV